MVRCLPASERVIVRTSKQARVHHSVNYSVLPDIRYSKGASMQLSMHAVVSVCKRTSSSESASKLARF
jgi:hypothetical protein